VIKGTKQHLTKVLVVNGAMKKCIMSAVASLILHLHFLSYGGKIWL
jgi:hypothetical protein